MIPVLVDYATPSVFESDRERALLGLSASARRKVRFHGRISPEYVFILRTALRAMGEAIWSDDSWLGAGDILDPVITVHPDRIFLEAFRQDQSTYVVLTLDPSVFQTEGEVATGTTNIDFTAWLWAALAEMRSSRDTWLRIGPEGFEVRTIGSGGRFERKVELPDSWVRGFLQIQGAMAMPGTRLTVRPVDLLSAIRFLRHTKAKLSPRALRFEMQPDEDARIVLEPWEHVVPLQGAAHGYTEPRTVRTWGRRRLKLIEPVLPFAESVDIYLKGRGLPVFYSAKLPGGITFTLGLTGWSGQTWTDSGSFDLLGDSQRPDESLVEAVQRTLAEQFSASAEKLAELHKRSMAEIWRACETLCRRGRAIFDIESRRFRHRELFEKPIDEAKLYPPDARREKADALLASNAIEIASCEVEETRKLRRLRTPEGPIEREIVHRDWHVKGSAGTPFATEIVINDTGRIIFGVCGCGFFKDNLMGRGPCEHMIALFRASESRRTDLPSSVPASEAAREAQSARKAARENDEEVDEEEADE